MGYLVLEMVVVGGEGLKDFNLSSPNMNVYVMVVLKGASFKDQNAQTNMVEGGENPSWNYSMKFYIDRSKQIEALKSQFTFTLKSKNNVDHEENIGQIIVPISELLQIVTINGDSMQVSYPIEETSKHIGNGKLHFALKLRSPQDLPPPMSPLSQQTTEASQLQKQEQEQGRPPRKYGKRLRDIGTKGVMALSITVASGYISKALFDNGQPSSSTNNHSPPSSSIDASSTSENSFYDESTPITNFDSTSALALDPATSSFYSEAPLFTTSPDTAASSTAAFDPTTSFSSGGTPLTALPDNATFPVATVDPITWFYSAGPPILDNSSSNMVLLSPSSSNGLFVPPSDAASVSTNCEDGPSSFLDSVVDALSSLF